MDRHDGTMPVELFKSLQMSGPDLSRHGPGHGRHGRTGTHRLIIGPQAPASGVSESLADDFKRAAPWKPEPSRAWN